MDSTIRFVFALIAYVLKGGTAPEQPTDLDWEKVYQIAVSQAISCIIAYGVIVNDYDIDEEIRKRLLQKMYVAISVDERQRQNCNEIFEAFEGESLDYLPLKGIILKNIYPEPEMRHMGDVDILINKNQFYRYKNILVNLGYEFKYQSDHEYVFQKQGKITIELHKHLIPSYNNDMYAYYQTGWDIAQKKENKSCWEFTNEDFYVYLITHFAKHYRDAGAGIKYILDIWLWQERYSMDTDYIAHQLDLLNLKQFAENLDRLIEAWFCGKQADPVTDAMTSFIVQSGQYGNSKNAGSARFLRLTQNDEYKERYKYFYLLFPNRNTMEVTYPLVKRFGWMLPYFWIHRIVTWALFRRHTMKIHKRVLETINDESMATYFAHMESVGLDIYNGRK